MADPTHSTTGSSGEARAMALLLDPLPDAMLVDKGLARDEAKARGAARERASVRWHKGRQLCEAAEHLFFHLDYLRMSNAFYGTPLPADFWKRHTDVRDHPLVAAAVTAYGELRSARALGDEDAKASSKRPAAP